MSASDPAATASTATPSSASPVAGSAAPGGRPDVPAGANVLLVRHGQSTWNAVGRWQGQANPPLSPLGLEQAALAGDRLRTWALAAAVVSSDLERARRTAQVLAVASGAPLLDAEPALRERHAGTWEGRTRDEIHAEFPGWIDGGRRPDGWEPDSALVERAVPALRRLVVARPDEIVVGVSHGGLIHALERAPSDPSTREGAFRRVANLEAVWFRVDDRGAVAVGDRVHLLPPDTGETFGPEA